MITKQDLVRINYQKMVYKLRMSEIESNNTGELVKKNKSNEIFQSLKNADDYMNQHGGKLRFDLGIDIWRKVKTTGPENIGNDDELINRLVELMIISKKGSKERNFFSNLAGREILFFQKNIENWDYDMVKNLMLVEDLGGKKVSQKMSAIFDRHKLELKQCLGGHNELTNPLSFVKGFFLEVRPDNYKVIKKRTDFLVGFLGLDEQMTNDMVNSWLTLDLRQGVIKGNPKKILTDTVSDNLFCLQMIKNRLGTEGINKLYTDYGITHFGRYPSDILIKQIEDEDINKPYGLWLGPWADWNGSFMHDMKDVRQINTDAQKLGYALKIIEARDKMSVVKRIIGLDKKFGDKNKIAFAVLGGHGDENSVFLGVKPEDSLTSNDLKKESATRIRKYYGDKPPFLFNACSTGRGIGPEYSNFGGGYSMSPDKEGVLSKVSLKKDITGVLFFEAEYVSRGEEVKTVIYKGGNIF